METTEIKKENESNIDIAQIKEGLEKAKKDVEFWIKQYNLEKSKFESLQKALLGLSDVAKLM